MNGFPGKAVPHSALMYNEPAASYNGFVISVNECSSPHRFTIDF